MHRSNFEDYEARLKMERVGRQLRSHNTRQRSIVDCVKSEAFLATIVDEIKAEDSASESTSSN